MYGRTGAVNEFVRRRRWRRRSAAKAGIRLKSFIHAFPPFLGAHWATAALGRRWQRAVALAAAAAIAVLWPEPPPCGPFQCRRRPTSFERGSSVRFFESRPCDFTLPAARSRGGTRSARPQRWTTRGRRRRHHQRPPPPPPPIAAAAAAATGAAAVDAALAVLWNPVPAAARAQRGLVVAVARTARQIHGPITPARSTAYRGLVARATLSRASAPRRGAAAAGRRRSATRRRCSARWHRHRRRARRRSRHSRFSTPSRRSRPPRSRAPRRRTATPPTSSRRCGRAQVLARRAAPAVPRRAVERLRVGPLPPPVDLQPRLPAVCQLRQGTVAAGGGARGGGGAAAAAGGAPLSVCARRARSRAASSAASRTCSRPSSSPPSAPSASASLILGARTDESPFDALAAPAAASSGAPTPTTRPARGRSRARRARSTRRRAPPEAAEPLVRAALRPLRRACAGAPPRARRRAPPHRRRARVGAAAARAAPACAALALECAVELWATQPRCSPAPPRRRRDAAPRWRPSAAPARERAAAPLERFPDWGTAAAAAHAERAMQLHAGIARPLRQWAGGEEVQWGAGRRHVSQ